MVLTGRGVRLVVDDTLADLGLKSITKADDIALFTGVHPPLPGQPRLVIDGPGEYEVSGLSIIGIAARGHMEDASSRTVTMYKILNDDTNYLVTGHVYPDLSDDQLEAIGMVDVMFVPVGGNGYTLDAVGALQLVKKVEPKLLVPTHYADAAIQYPVPQQNLEQVLRSLAMEPRETTNKLRFKAAEATDAAQLVVLSRS